MGDIEFDDPVDLVLHTSEGEKRFEQIREVRARVGLLIDSMLILVDESYEGHLELLKYVRRIELQGDQKRVIEVDDLLR
ncbi:hypothetical protein [Salinibacter ruber]|uniref:hypothetical protein n=1 Tax=Salinibacter ruber TaxID=146919 RepID=UPI0020736DB0|nr:hypothetical protein [Salinibacter ruber]